MKELYLKLLEIFFAQDAKVLFTDNGLTPIAHIDIYKGQYIQPEAFQAFPTPALFLEFSTLWSDKGRKTQHGDSIVRMHIVLENPSESYSGAPDQDHALQVFDYWELVNYLLTGLDGPRQTGLQRTGEDFAFSEDPNLLPHVLTYKCLLTDDTTDSLFKKYSGTAIPEDVALTKVPPVPPAAPVIPDQEPGYVI